MTSLGTVGFLKRWWFLIVLGPVVAGAAGYVAVGQVPPAYQANSTLLVERGSLSTTGGDDPTASETLGRTYVEALKTRPVLDAAAPVLAQADAALLSSHVDGVIFVVDAQKARGRRVRRALELLNEAGAHVLGAAFNRVSPRHMDYVQYESYAPDNDAQSEDASAPGKIVGARARSEAK